MRRTRFAARGWTWPLGITAVVAATATMFAATGDASGPAPRLAGTSAVVVAVATAGGAVAAGDASDAVDPAPANAARANPSVAVEAPARCELGGRCAIVVRATCGADAACELRPPSGPGAFEVISIVEDGPRSAPVRAWRITLVAFDPGTHEVPPILVHARPLTDAREAWISREPVRIEIVPPDLGDEPALRDLAGPLDPGRDWRVAGAVAAALVAAGGFLLAGRHALRWWRRSRRRGPPEPTVADILAAIQALRHAPATTADDIVSTYRGLARELRRFYRLAYSVRAEALTSHELVDVTARDRCGRQRAGDCRDLLEAIDRVKFGGERPGRDARDIALARARDLVKALAPAAGDLPPDSARRTRDVA